MYLIFNEYLFPVKDKERVYESKDGYTSLYLAKPHSNDVSAIHFESDIYCLHDNIELRLYYKIKYEKMTKHIVHCWQRNTVVIVRDYRDGKKHAQYYELTDKGVLDSKTLVGPPICVL